MLGFLEADAEGGRKPKGSPTKGFPESSRGADVFFGRAAQGDFVDAQRDEPKGWRTCCFSRFC